MRKIKEVIKPKETKQQEVIGTKKVELDFAGRGFSSLKDAEKFPETYYFKQLGKADQDEYLNWLKS